MRSTNLHYKEACQWVTWSQQTTCWWWWWTCSSSCGSVCSAPLPPGCCWSCGPAALWGRCIINSSWETSALYLLWGVNVSVDVWGSLTSQTRARKSLYRQKVQRSKNRATQQVLTRCETCQSKEVLRQRAFRLTSEEERRADVHRSLQTPSVSSQQPPVDVTGTAARRSSAEDAADWLL